MTHGFDNFRYVCSLGHKFGQYYQISGRIIHFRFKPEVGKNLPWYPIRTETSMFTTKMTLFWLQGRLPVSSAKTESGQKIVIRALIRRESMVFPILILVTLPYISLLHAWPLGNDLKVYWSSFRSSDRFLTERRVTAVFWSTLPKRYPIFLKILTGSGFNGKTRVDI